MDELEFYVPHDIEHIINRFKTNKDSHFFKEAALMILQEYFDIALEEQAAYDKNCLDALIDCTRLAVASSLDFIPRLTELFDTYGLFLTRHISGEFFRSECYGSSDLKWFSINITKSLKNSSIDTVIPIASGGFEGGILAADRLGIDDIFPVRYSIRGRKDSRVHYLEKPESIAGRKVLIVDDFIGTGDTIMRVLGWLRNYSPKKVFIGTLGFGCRVKPYYLGLEEINPHFFTPR